MNSIVFLIPYYGKVPSYFKAFLHTICSKSSFADFILFSEEDFCKEIEAMQPSSNFHCVPLCWKNLCEIVRGINVNPPFFPYKICDYKPLFGRIFENYIKGYEYWGYCDVDLLMGDIEKYLTEYSYKNYERFGAKGHFTIYKNCDKVNNLWQCSYKEHEPIYNFNFVSKTTYSCNFDEIGMNFICKKMGISFFDKQLELNTTLDTRFLHSGKYKDFPQIFTWENGNTYTYVKNDEKIEKIECMYIHFLWTKNLSIQENFYGKILVTHDGFFLFDENNIENYFEKYGKVENLVQRQNNVKLYARRKRMDRLKKLFRELRTVKLRTVYNVVCRLPGIFNLFREGTF